MPMNLNRSPVGGLNKRSIESQQSKKSKQNHSPTGAPAPAKPRPFLHPPAPVKRPNDRGVFAGFSYFYWRRSHTGTVVKHGHR